MQIELQIPEFHLSKLQKELDKLNARAELLHQRGHISEPTLLKYEIKKEHHISNESCNARFVKVFDIVLSGEMPVVSGFRFLAHLHHVPSGTIITRSYVGDGYDLSEFTDRKSQCDHCNLKRKRNDTFILTDDDKIVQIGRTCLLDYLRSDKIETILAIFDTIKACQDMTFSGDSEELFSGPSYLRTKVILAFAFRSIELYGWCSATEARDSYSKTSTRTLVELAVYYPLKYPEAQPLPENFEQAEHALDWGKQMPGNTDYTHNCRVSCQNEYVTDNTIGYVVSVARAWQRDQLTRSQGEGSDYVGKEKERLKNLTVEVVNVFNSFNSYGNTQILILRDESGNILKWTNSRPSNLYDLGKTLILDGTVKGHAEFRGVKQTSLTRCKVHEVK